MVLRLPDLVEPLLVWPLPRSEPGVGFQGSLSPLDLGPLAISCSLPFVGSHVFGDTADAPSVAVLAAPEISPRYDW